MVLEVFGGLENFKYIHKQKSYDIPIESILGS